MSMDMAKTIDALRRLASALGPRLPGVTTGARAAVDFGRLAPDEYTALEAAMKVTITFDHVDELGCTELSTHGYIDSVSVSAKTVRPASSAELLERIEKLKAAVAARQAAGVPVEVE